MTQLSFAFLVFSGLICWTVVFYLVLSVIKDNKDNEDNDEDKNVL